MEEPSYIGDDHLFDSVSIPSELNLLFYFFPLEELFNWIGLEFLADQTRYLDIVFPYSYVTS